MEILMTLSRYEVLKHIKNHPEGLTFGEIQRFVVEAHGLNYDEFERFTCVWNGRKISRRKYRGWWCDNLLGACKSPYRGRVGILIEFCDKVGKKYFLKPDAKIFE
jgi:hypothetical protein